MRKRLVTPRTLTAVLPIVLFFSNACATPAYFSTVANQVLRLQGGARLLEGDGERVQAVVELEKQVKRVMGADPAKDLNVSALRDRPDTELLRILLLAMLGNFTSAAGADWNRPCSLVVDPESGRIVLETSPPLTSLALKVVLVLLVAVQIRQWVEETMRTRAQETARTRPQPQAAQGEPERHATQRKGL